MADYGDLVANDGIPETAPEKLVYRSDIADNNLNYDAGSVPQIERTPSGARIPDISTTIQGYQPQSPLERPSYTMDSQTMADPMMRQAFVMPAAGLPARGHHANDMRLFSTPGGGLGRQYKMASDIFGTGMDRTWATEHPVTDQFHQNPGPQNNEPSSFKITEYAKTATSAGSGLYEPLEHEETASTTPSNRKARESAGNPLTGQGYDTTSTKTAKRYFEGSNANQKLW